MRLHCVLQSNKILRACGAQDDSSRLSLEQRGGETTFDARFRARKVRLIEQKNPTWKDLADTWFAAPSINYDSLLP